MQHRRQGHAGVSREKNGANLEQNCVRHHPMVEKDASKHAMRRIIGTVGVSASFVEGLERDCFPAVKGSNLEHVMMSYGSELQTESAKIRQKYKIVQVELQVVF